MKQVGIFARRGADGSFLPSQPIYRDGDGRVVTKAQDELAFELGVSLASDYERYVKACKAAGRAPG